MYIPMSDSDALVVTPILPLSTAHEDEGIVVTPARMTMRP